MAKSFKKETTLSPQENFKNSSSLPSLNFAKKTYQNKGVALISPTSLKALRDGLSPSWMQEHRIIPKSSIDLHNPHVCDLWSSKQRYSAMKKLFPHAFSSKVAKEFRKNLKQERSQEIAKKLDGLLPCLKTRFKYSQNSLSPIRVI